MKILEMRKAFGTKIKTGMFYWWLHDLYIISWPKTPTNANDLTYRLVNVTYWDSETYWDWL